MSDATNAYAGQKVDADAFGGTYGIYLRDGSVTTISGSNLAMEVTPSGALTFSYGGATPTHAYASGQWLSVNLAPSK